MKQDQSPAAQAQQAPPPDPMLQAANEAEVQKTQSEATKNQAQAAKLAAEAQMAQFQPAPGMMMQ